MNGRYEDIMPINERRLPSSEQARAISVFEELLTVLETEFEGEATKESPDTDTVYVGGGLITFGHLRRARTILEEMKRHC